MRVRVVFEMSNNLRRIVEAGIRNRQPDFDQKRIRLEVLRLMIGDKLARVISESVLLVKVVALVISIFFFLQLNAPANPTAFEQSEEKNRLGRGPN